VVVISRRVVVHGRVQGVWFRETTRRTAERNGVSGWVRNREDGTVEAVFEGAAEAVERLVDFCRLGPPEARVTRVDVEPGEPSGLTGFDVL
jgi:acylphosphatase